ncbi:carboxymethylenebutenolidase [Sphingomonas sp. ABOLG]|jgi:dienelactone hydrolase|uniref:dienelactone hydrolase family protein n=1 Tax=Sphingomonas TaxID=13687 RepID=UPI000620EF0B|nr:MULTISPECIES: dienelactone hydrolase family protein [unclassified Sphingomonas]KKI18645.1 carboxymethylenebutenolidase [Sphingomonas sp. Ag1]RSV20436.1 carboxymethylenebutenolidase [Sphingomonas sp. ABOLG]
MAIVRQTLVYDGPGGPFEGVITWEDEVETQRPGVLVCPNILGQKEADNQKAEDLAKLGYVALACDVFGQGRRKTRESSNVSEYMDELDADRGLLRDRLAASLAALRGFASVDPARVAAIGFCFGGKCVLDMARAGLPILGGVSFHGVYDRPDYANVDPITAKLLICHGWEDPLCPPDTMVALGQELTAGKADWQIHAYGHAGHAFTDTSVPAGRTPGFGYDENADRRSWKAMSDFLAELFL